MRTRTYIIIDPQHIYAMELIARIHNLYGLRPVCLYTDPRAEFEQRPRYPRLRSSWVEASFYLAHNELPELCRKLSAAYDIVGIVPHYEKALAPAAELLAHLPVAWNSAEVIRRFRDKQAVKAHLRAHHPEVPMNQSRRVCSAAEVFAEPLPARYVIKPNDGYANRNVQFFRRDEPRALVERYFARDPGGSYILEDFLEGDEYVVNGQIDQDGVAHVINVVQYERRAGNGVPNLYYQSHHIRRTDPPFAPIAGYVKAVMEASGLTRSPFHTEVMYTPEGPRLIEVGARLGGNQYAYMANNLHGGRFDIFAWAAHHYLFDTPYPDPGLDWAFHDAHSYLHVDGCAPRTELVYRIDGMREVEALPEFRRWVVRPRVGDKVRRTIDMLTTPYAFQLMSAGSREEICRVGDRARAMVRINAQPDPRLRRRAVVKNLLRRARSRGMWYLHTLLHR